MSTKEIALKAASAALTIGVGLCTGQHFLDTEPILSAVFMNVVAGIGGGQVSELWDSGLRRAGQMWETDDAVLNHDLVRALGTAMQQAFELGKHRQLIGDLKSRPRFYAVSREERRRIEADVRTWLRDMYEFFAFRDDVLHVAITEEQKDFRTLTNANLQQVVLSRMQERLLEYFNNEFVVEFLLERFKPEMITPHFIAILKQSRKDGSGAWTAYEMLVYQNLQAGLVLNRSLIEEHREQSQQQYSKLLEAIEQIHTRLDSLHQRSGSQFPNSHRQLSNISQLFGRKDALQQMRAYFESESPSENYLLVTGMPGIGRRALTHYFLRNDTNAGRFQREILRFVDTISFEAELSRIKCQTENDLVEWVAQHKILLLLEIGDGFLQGAEAAKGRITNLLRRIVPSENKGRLILVGELGWDELAPAYKIDLAPLSANACLSLLQARIWRDRQPIEWDTIQQHRLQHIIEMLGGHPASIELIANRIRSNDIATVHQDLEAQFTGNQEVSTASLHTVMITRAVETLNKAVASALFLLSLYPPDYSISSREINRAVRLVPQFNGTSLSIVHPLRTSGLLQVNDATYHVHPVVRRIAYEYWQQGHTSITPSIMQRQQHQIGRILLKDKRWLEALLYLFRAERWGDVWNLFQTHYPHASKFSNLQVESSDPVAPMRAGYAIAYIWQSLGMSQTAWQQANKTLSRTHQLSSTVSRDALLLLLYSVLIVTSDRLGNDNASNEMEAEDALMLLDEQTPAQRERLRSEEVQLRISIGRLVQDDRIAFAAQTVALSGTEQSTAQVNALLWAKARSSLAYALANSGEFERGLAESKRVLTAVKTLKHTKETQEMIATELTMQLLFLHLLERSEEAIALIEAEHGEQLVRDFGGSSDVYLGFLINLATAEIGVGHLASAESRLRKARELGFQLGISYDDEIDLRLAEIDCLRGNKTAGRLLWEKLDNKRDELDAWLIDEIDKLGNKCFSEGDRYEN